MPLKKDKEDKEDEAMSGSRPKISFSDLEKSMITFTGDDTYPIATWIQEFEDTASIMEWSKIEKLIYGKRLLGGTAKLFLRSLGSVTDWETLKKNLKEEFGPKLNSAIVHKQLASRKMKNDESFQQYFLHMKELALHASVEDEALMEYVIDGIRDSETNKAILYGAIDIKEFRAKLESYSQLRKRIDSKAFVRQNNPTTSNSPSTERKPFRKRCYNCGDTDHVAPACTKGIKCFRCNEYGHKGTECPTLVKKSLNIRIKKEASKIPYKKVKLNGVDMTAFIDTGSDVNLIKTSKLEELEEEKPDYENSPKICLIGIGEKKINTEGSFVAKLQIDDCFVDTDLHVVKDEVIPVNLILGNPILHDHSINFTSDGITVERLTNLTLPIEERNLHDDLDKKEEMVKERKPTIVKEESYVGNKTILTERSDRIKDADDQGTQIDITTEILEGEPNEDLLLEDGILTMEKDGKELIVVQEKMQHEVIKKNHEKRHYDGIRKLIDEDQIAYSNESRPELRGRATVSIQKTENENRKSYNKKRKKANQYVDVEIQKKRKHKTRNEKIGQGEGTIDVFGSSEADEKQDGRVVIG